MVFLRDACACVRVPPWTPWTLWTPVCQTPSSRLLVSQRAHAALLPRLSKIEQVRLDNTQILTNAFYLVTYSAYERLYRSSAKLIITSLCHLGQIFAGMSTFSVLLIARTSFIFESAEGFQHQILRRRNIIS